MGHRTRVTVTSFGINLVKRKHLSRRIIQLRVSLPSAPLQQPAGSLAEAKAC